MSDQDILERLRDLHDRGQGLIKAHQDELSAEDLTKLDESLEKMDRGLDKFTTGLDAIGGADQLPDIITDRIESDLDVIEARIEEIEEDVGINGQ